MSFLNPRVSFCSSERNKWRLPGDASDNYTGMKMYSVCSALQCSEMQCTAQNAERCIVVEFFALHQIEMHYSDIIWNYEIWICQYLFLSTVCGWVGLWVNAMERQETKKKLIHDDRTVLFCILLIKSAEEAWGLTQAGIKCADRLTAFWGRSHFARPRLMKSLTKSMCLWNCWGSKENFVRPRLI